MGFHVQVQSPRSATALEAAPRARSVTDESWRRSSHQSRSTRHVRPSTAWHTEQGTRSADRGSRDSSSERVASESPVAEGQAAEKISASGTSDISISYAPSASNKSSKIVFIQTVRDMMDGAYVKPSTLGSFVAFKDADLTSAFWCVDYLQGEADPYYNGDDAGKDSGTQGNATSTPPVPATMTDTPGYADGSFPSGKATTFWEFRTASFSAAGPDQGTFYDYVVWSFAKEKGKPSAVKVGSTGTGSPGSEFQDAVNKWCSNHGFVLPKPSASGTSGAPGTGGAGSAPPPRATP
jgi:hypothetical protein